MGQDGYRDPDEFLGRFGSPSPEAVAKVQEIYDRPARLQADAQLGARVRELLADGPPAAFRKLGGPEDAWAWFREKLLGEQFACHPERRPARSATWSGARSAVSPAPPSRPAGR